MKQVINEVNSMRRMSPTLFFFLRKAEAAFQVTSFNGTSRIGYLLLIHRRIMTSLPKDTMMEPQRGSSGAVPL